MYNIKCLQLIGLMIIGITLYIFEVLTFENTILYFLALFVLGFSGIIVSLDEMVKK